MFLTYNIKLFTANSNIHKAKLIKRHRVHYRRKQKKPLDDNAPVGNRLLDKIVFAAEFTISCNLGLFHCYGRLLKCRSPPSVLVFSKYQNGGLK